jgi:hypothetical protein
MTPTVSRVLAGAWRLFRGERDLIVRVAAPLVFLPAFAALLLTDPLPPLPDGPRDEAAIEAWLTLALEWARGNALPYVVADLIGIYGAAVLATLLLAPARPTVAEALRGAAARLLPFLAVSLIAAVPVGLGMQLLVLPGLYAQARLATAIPALAARGRLGPIEALRDSLRRTRGHGLALTGAMVALFLLQYLAVVPLLSVDDGLRAVGRENPVVLALVDALVAAAGAAYHVGVLLVGVVAYRRASNGT